MQVVILAAGEGTRMRPLTEQRAKPMLPVAGRPMVEHVAQSAAAAAVDELIVVVGYEGQRVREYLGDSVGGTPVRYVEQTEQNGTADAVWQAREHLDGPFAVLNGDSLYEETDIERLFENRPALACTRVDEPSNYGVVETEGDHVERLIEKPDDPPSSLVNAGAYVFPADARAKLDVPESERGEHELTDVLNAVAETSDITPVEIDGWLDVGRPWELLEANERQLGQHGRRIDGHVHEEATIEGDVVVESSAAIGPDVTVEGPVVIQSGAAVGPSAHIQGPTLLGPDTKISHGVEVRNSVIMQGTSVDLYSVIADSVVGSECELGPYTVFSNRLADEEPVRLTVKGDTVSTGRERFGAVVGDRVETKTNTALAPGVKLSTGETTETGERVSCDR